MSNTDRTDAPLTRGHKKRERTRQSLIEAALRLLARKEVGEVALLEVATEAEVANGTIYNYFRTRDEVIEAVGIALADKFSETISALSIGVNSGAIRLAIGVRMFIRRAAADPTWASAVIRVVHFDQAIRSKIANYVLIDLRAGAEEGVLSYPDENIARDLVVSCVIGGMRAAKEGRGIQDHDSQVAEMVLKALGATPARARKIAQQPLPS